MSNIDQNTTLKQVLEDHRLWLSGRGGSKANLSGADLSGADLSWADLSWADLSRADLSGANLSRADLSRADLSGANLSRANLSRADLSGADLSGADLSRANLSRADLSWADLSGADLIKTLFENDHPIIINTEIWCIVKTRDFIKIGCQIHTVDEWKEFTDEQISKMESRALVWWKKYKKLVLSEVNYE